MHKLFILLFVTFNLGYSHTSSAEQSVLNLPADSYGLYYTLGVDYYKSNELATAIAIFTKAIELGFQSGDIELGFRSGDMYNKRGLAYYFAGNIDLALLDFDRGIRLEPTNSEIYYNRSKVYLVLKNELKALKDLEKAITKDPSFFKPYNSRGILHFKLGELKKAIQDFTKVIELNPKFSEAYYNLGEVYTALGEHEKAIANYTKAIKLGFINKNQYRTRVVPLISYPNFFNEIISSNSTKSHINLGKAKVNRGYYDEAIKEFTQIIKKNSQSDIIAEIYYNRGIAFLGKSLITLSVKDFEEAIKLGYNVSASHYNQSITLLIDSLISSSIKDFEKAIELGFNVSASYRYLGRAIIKSTFSMNQQDKVIKILDKAIKVLDKAIELGLTSVEAAEVYSDRALALTLTLRKEDKLKAIADYTKSLKSLKLDSTSAAKNYNRRGIVYFKLGNLQKAIAEFRHIIYININFYSTDVYKIAEAYNNLGEVYTALGEHEEAIKMFIKAIELNPKLETLKNRGTLLNTVIYPDEFDVIFNQKSEANRSKAKQRVDSKKNPAPSGKGKGSCPSLF